MPKRPYLKAIPARLDHAAVARIVEKTGLPLLASTSLAELAADLNFERVQFASLDLERLATYVELIELTPLIQFLGGDLPEVFEKHFGRQVGRSRRRNKTEPYGPYVRFACAVMYEFGEPEEDTSTKRGQEVSPHTVDAALKKVRRRRARAMGK